MLHAPLIGLSLILSLAIAAPAPASQEPPVPARLVLTVVDEDGTPLDEVRCVATPSIESGPVDVDTFWTRDGGKIDIDLPPGRAQSFWVYRGQFRGELEIEALKPGQEIERTFEVKTRDDTTFRARVVGENGDPVVGAVVHHSAARHALTLRQRPARIAPPQEPAAKTDSDGAFEIGAATWRHSKVTVFAEGYAPRRIMVGGSFGRVGLDEPVSIRLERAATVDITIEGIDDPLVVTARAYSHALFDDVGGAMRSEYIELVRFDAKRTPDGRYSLVGLPPRSRVTLVALQEGRAIHEVKRFLTPLPGRSKSITWSLASDRTVRGVLVDEEGKPLAGERIWITADGASTKEQFGTLDEPMATCVTDAEGRFVFEGVPANVFRVGLAHRRLAGRAAAVQASPMVPTTIVDTTGDDEPEPVRLVGVVGLTIRGRLVGPDGAPAKGSILAVHFGSGHQVQCQAAADDGSFVLGPLLRETYSIMAHSGVPGYGNAEMTPVAAGNADLVLRLRHGGSIAATVVDSATGRRVQASVKLYRNGETGWTRTAARVDRPARFRGLQPGDYTVQATTGDGLVGVARVYDLATSTEPTKVEIELYDAARIRIACGQEIAGGDLSVELRGEGGFRADASLPAPGDVEVLVPADEYWIRVEGRGELDAAETTLSVEAGTVVDWNAVLPSKKKKAKGGGR